MAPTVRVATYNLYLGADLALLLGDRPAEELDRHRAEVQRQLAATAFPRRAAALATVLAREAADLVGLQEVCRWRVDGTPLWDFSALLLHALAEHGVAYERVAAVDTFEGTAPVPDGSGGTVHLELTCGNAVLRRVDSAWDAAGSTSGLFGEAMTTALLGGTGMAIGRGWCAVDIQRPGGRDRFTLATTHTEAHDQQARDAQRDELLTVLGEGPLVLVGDFNAPPQDVGMPPTLVDAWLAGGGAAEGPLAATSGQAPDLGNVESALRDRIDYVWVRDLTVRGARRIGAEPPDRALAGLWPSDHAGVVADLDCGHGGPGRRHRTWGVGAPDRERLTARGRS